MIDRTNPETAFARELNSHRSVVVRFDPRFNRLVSTGMGGALTKREGVLLRSFQSEARKFSCFFQRFTSIKTSITISLLDTGLQWCFMDFLFRFEGVLLAVIGCTCALRGCLRTLKTPNSPPVSTGHQNKTAVLSEIFFRHNSGTIVFVSWGRIEPCILWPLKVNFKIWPQVRVTKGHEVT